MTATAIPRGKTAPARPPRPVVSLDDILLELIDIGDNVRDDVGDLDELAASIAELGVLDPVKVTRQDDGRYRLVWGQRRVLASRKAGQLRIPAIIEPASDIDSKSARRSIEQLSENLQRKDLNPIEEAVALREVLDGNPGLTQAALAQRLGRSAPWISSTLALLDVDPTVQDQVRTGALSAAHVKAIAVLDPADQVEIATKAIDNAWSAHELERQAKYAKDYAKDGAKERARRREQDARRVVELVPLLEKVANRKRSTIGVADYGGSGVGALLKADGWKVVDGWTVAKLDEAGSCGCAGVWRVEVPYDAKSKVKLSPGCNSKEHADARRALQEAEWRQQREAQTAERATEAKATQGRAERLGAWLVEHPRDLFSRRLLIYGLVDADARRSSLVETYLAGDDEETHDDRDDATWDAICAIPEDDLTTVLARALAETVLDNWRLSKTVREAIDERAPAPEPKPAKGKKAAP